MKIIDHAAEWHADLIVAGSHGWEGLNRFLLGSVSESVVRHAPCSVEVVRTRSATEHAQKKRARR
jgi:nucleotide-binding universal stress UspA family protein